MEHCDVYDETGRPTGRVVERGANLSRDEYILVVQVWIRNQKGEYLIQQRAPHLESAPGVWATTAGHVQAGEDSLSGAVREVSEELGIQLIPRHLQRFTRIIQDGLIQDVWLAQDPGPTLGMPVIGSEVAGWMWASRAKIEEMIAQGIFFRYSYFDTLAE